MANIKDYVDESGNPKTPEPAKAVAEDLPSVEEPQEDDIPEKFRGKPLKDVIQMYQEAEKALGRHGQENGDLKKTISELQKTVDALILQQGQSPKEPDEEIDYFTDPDKAIEKKLSSNPDLKELKTELQQLKAQAQAQQLMSKHPDANQIAHSPEFLEWVQQESGRRILLEAAQAGNPAAADSILTDFKKYQKPKEDNRKTETKRAQTGATTAAASQGSRKIYNRHDVIELMKKDHRKYMALMQGDLGRAYREGRVRD